MNRGHIQMRNLMRGYNPFISDDPKWFISVRVRGPTGTIPKKTQNRATRVFPNEGITLLELLSKLHVELSNPSEWEIEALRHRPQEDRPRKKLNDTVKNVLMHYRKRVTGHLCFFLVRRRVASNASTSVERYHVTLFPIQSQRPNAHRTTVINNGGHYHTCGRTMTTTSLHHGLARPHAHLALPPLRRGTDLETMGNIQPRNQQPVRIPQISRAADEMQGQSSERDHVPPSTVWTSGQLTNRRLEHQQQKVGSGITTGGGGTHVLKSYPNLIATPNLVQRLENRQGRMDMVASQVNCHVPSRVQQAAGPWTSSGANRRVVANGSAQQEQNTVPRVKPQKKHCFVGVGVMGGSNSNPFNAVDIAKKLEDLKKYLN